MRRIITAATLLGTLSGIWMISSKGVQSSYEETAAKLEVAVFDKDNGLKRPEGYEEWIFLGTTMGLTYFGDEPDPDDVGLFSSVYIEPQAYKVFQKTGEFPEGTVFAKVVRDTESVDDGYFMGGELALEIHVKDRERFPKHGFNFYFFSSQEEEYAMAMPEDNICVSCHLKEAEFDNTFTQFYPSIRAKLSKLDTQ